MFPELDMHTRHATIIAFLALAGTLLLNSCKGPEGNAANGQRWFSMHNCTSCHGANANDGRATAIAALDLSYGSFVSYLRNPSSPSMPRFSEKKLTDQDAADIYAWLKNLPE